MRTLVIYLATRQDATVIHAINIALLQQAYCLPILQYAASVLHLNQSQ
jgi:hypothetical protein